MKKFTFLLVLLSIILIVHAQSPYAVHQNITKSVSEEKSKEKIFIEDNFPYIPMNKWKAGMRFIVPYDERYDKDGTIREFFTFKKSNKLRFDRISKEEFKWKTFTLLYLEYGTDGYLYLVFDCEGEKYKFYSYKTEKDFNDGKDSFIDGLVYVDEIDRLKNSLLGKTLYIMDKGWGDAGYVKGGPGYKSPEKSKKFYPVVIKSIGVGTITDTNPIRIIFETESENEFYMDIKVSNTNNLYSGKRDWYNLERENRTIFYNVFSFDDPHLMYPHINSEVWHKIQEGTVSIGMTEEECTLSWGKPKEINRSSYGSDQWVYSGQYLYFDDGKLTAFN